MLTAGLGPVLADTAEDPTPSNDEVLPQVLSESSAIWNGTRAYIFGGTTDDGGERTSSLQIYEFDPEGPTVQQAGTLPGAPVTNDGRTATSAVWDDDKLVAYVFGGKTGIDPGPGDPTHLTEIVEWDPAAGGEGDAHSASFGSPRSGTSAVWTGDVAYIFGGRNLTGYLPDIIKFDPGASEPLTKVANLPEPMAETSAVWTGSEAYIFGGEDAQGAAQDWVVRFEPGSGAEFVDGGATSLEEKRASPSAVWTGTEAFVIGGDKEASSTNSGARKSSDRFVPGSGVDAWHDLDSTRWGTSAVFDGEDTAYVFGGDDDGTLLDDIANYSVSQTTHLTDLTASTPDPWNATDLSGSRLSITAEFDVENHHLPCKSNETGCALPAGAEVGVYLRDLDKNLSELSIDDLTDSINGTWPEQRATVLDPVEGGETQTLTVPQVSLGNYSAGDVVTVIGVVDWCKERYFDVDPSHHCAVEEEGEADGDETILYDQWILRPSLEITTDVVVPSDSDDQIATTAPEEGEFVNHTEVLVNVTNLGSTSLDFNPDDSPNIVDDLVLNYTVDGKCPDGASEPGDDPCETTMPGPDPGQTTQERIRWNSDVAGERHLSLTIGYPHLPDVKDGTEPDNHPTTNSASDSVYYKGVDWVAGQTVGTTSAQPGDDHIVVDSTVANVGDLAAEDSVDDDPLVLEWDRCNRLVQPGTDYRCPDTAASEEWQPLNQTDSVSQHAFKDLSQFPAGGTAQESITWEKSNQSVGVWSVRSFLDLGKTWGQGLEHSRDNNADRSTVRLSDVAWTGAPRPFEQEFVDIDAGSPLNFNLTLSNKADEDRSFEVFRVITDCEPSPCDDTDNWKFHLLNETDTKLNQEQGLGQGWHPGGSGPVTVPEVGAGKSAELAFRVVPQEPVEPDHFVNATLVVCEDGEFDGAGACLANGDLIRTRAFFDPPWNPIIKMQSPTDVSVDAGDTASFFFKIENGAEVKRDAFQLTADIEPGSAASEPKWTRLDPDSNCQKDDHTVDPDHPDAKGKCGTLFRIAMDPGESNRFRMRTTVDEAVPEDTVVNVTLEATSKKSNNESGPTIKKTRLLRIGVGTDIAPPEITAEPASGAVVKPGTPIDFEVTDDGEVASVERQIDDGRFQAFQGDEYVVETAGRPDGEMKIRVRARDDAARERTKTFRYTVDGTPPAFQAVQVDPSVAFVGGTIDIAVGLSEDNPSSVVAETAGATHDLTFRSATGLYEAKSIAVSEETGVYSVSVTAADLAGNQRASNASYEVVRPDVSIVSEDLTTDPRSPTAGDPLTVTAKLSNPAGADITDYPVVLRVGNETVATTNATLVANAKTAVTLEWISEAGGHDLSVCGDPGETIPDPDRSNQCGQVSIRVRDQSLIPGPEIVIIAAALVLGALGRRRWDARNADERYPRD